MQGIEIVRFAKLILSKLLVILMFKLTWIFTYEPNIIIKINLNNKTYHIRSHQGCMPLYRFHIFRMDPKRHIFDHAALVKKSQCKNNVTRLSIDFLFSLTVPCGNHFFQKWKFSIRDIFSYCDQIRRQLQILSS